MQQQVNKRDDNEKHRRCRYYFTLCDDNLYVGFAMDISLLIILESVRKADVANLSRMRRSVTTIASQQPGTVSSILS